MPLNRSQLKSDRKNLPEIKIADGTLNIEYTPSTPRYLDELIAFERARQNDASLTVSGNFAKQILPLLAGWDYTEDDGTPVPITEETLAELPIWVLRTISQGIISSEASDQGNA